VKYNKVCFSVENILYFKQQMLDWGNQFNICCFFDNHQYHISPNFYECILAVNPVFELNPKTNYLEALKTFIHQHQNQWIFGHVSFDLKDEIFNTNTSANNKINFSPLYFFVPETVITLKDSQLTIYTIKDNVEAIYNSINNVDLSFNTSQNTTDTIKLNIKSKINKEAYVSAINKLKEHIKRGDCYEINFCQEFFASEATINPLQVYVNLVEISPNPFSAYYKINNQFLMCASPERFIAKHGTKLVSQPIKGTIKRDIKNKTKDDLLKDKLKNSEKEKSENVMIVDLVRNDLSKICNKGTVHVDELFGIYSFPQVHQMISTISGEVEEDINFASILQATFPMGSMTGAPKKRVLELTEKYENINRGIYSGSVGYISPENNFDFNVVIRSIMYNSNNKYLSYMVGGGITFNSNAEDEYDECLLKAEAIKKVLK
jgi:para-aminobenzoate synthetase component 1